MSAEGTRYSLKAGCLNCGRYGTIDDRTFVCTNCGAPHTLTAEERRQLEDDFALWQMAGMADVA